MHPTALRLSSTLLAASFLFAPLTQALAQTAGTNGGATASAPAANPEAQFPHAIRVTMWPAPRGFSRGDDITIASVRGDRKRIEPGGTYLVQGTYKLSSAPTGMIALSLTSSANGGRSAWADSQRYSIEQGSGTFALIATMRAAGEFHVSFYLPARGNTPKKGSFNSAGGIYFDNR